jgi:hypothetical protein
MKDLKLDELVGISNEDGSVKCRECMSEEDWKDLTQENTITEGYRKKDEEWIYCDYCERKL